MRYQIDTRITARLQGGFIFAALIYESEPLRDGSSTSGATSPVQVVPGSQSLTPAERVSIVANRDGTVTRAQYMQGMEQRWDAMTKDTAGNLPAAPAVTYPAEASPIFTTPNY